MHKSRNTLKDFKRNNAISRNGLNDHALSHEPLTQG